VQERWFTTREALNAFIAQQEAETGRELAVDTPESEAEAAAEKLRSAERRRRSADQWPSKRRCQRTNGSGSQLHIVELHGGADYQHAAAELAR